MPAERVVVDRDAGTVTVAGVTYDVSDTAWAGVLYVWRGQARCGVFSMLSEGVLDASQIDEATLRAIAAGWFDAARAALREGRTKR